MVAEPKSGLDAGTLPDGWRMVTFGQVARNVDVQERNPLENGIDRYVGLDHLEPGNLHIRSWGNVTDGTTFTRRFKSGQVLFGKRRAYQRKAAFAEFEGICSGDILVFEPSGDDLLPDLLPFIVESDGFFEHALRTSAGSLSPRTKWKELAEYGFPLPPKEEQRRIADILWAADAAVERWREVETMLAHLLWASLRATMGASASGDALSAPEDRVFPAHWKVEALEDIAKVERGKFGFRPRNLPRFYGDGYPFVQTGDVASAGPRLTSYSQNLSEEGRKLSKSFPPRSILITIAAIIGSTTVTEFEVWCPDSVVGIVPRPGMRVEFLEYYLRTCQSYLDTKAATQTAQKNINLQKLRPLRVPVPPDNEQLAIVRALGGIELGSAVVKTSTDRLGRVGRSVLDAILSGRANV